MGIAAPEVQLVGDLLLQEGGGEGGVVRAKGVFVADDEGEAQPAELAQERAERQRRDEEARHDAAQRLVLLEAIEERVELAGREREVVPAGKGDDPLEV